MQEIWRTKLALFCILTAGLFIIMALPVNAQAQLGIQGSFAEDVDFGVGGRIESYLGQVYEGLGIIGSANYYFPDAGNYFDVNGDIVYSIPIEGSIAPYFGGGLTFARWSSDHSDNSDTEVTANLLGGIKFTTNQRGLSPFIEFKIELGGYEQFVFSGGFLF